MPADAAARLHPVDLVVLVGYLLVTTFTGCWFLRRNRSSEHFMAAGRALPGWAVGLSLFGSYVSSISFLANPGKSFADDWNPFVFALSIPLACAVAARWFVPLYRTGAQISAYEHFESRFGGWARVYAVVCFLLLQVARLGTILYLLALALQPLVGIPLPWLIVVLGLMVMVYPMLGGAEGAIWTGVVQALVLLLGPLACLAILLTLTPGGLGGVVATGAAAGKFSLGTFSPDLAASSFWTMLLYGLATNLQNFGIDQAYVQRYLTARDDRAAARSVWMGGMLYLPVAAAFFFIGTALWVFARTHALPDGLKADAVFPWFIQNHLPVGLKGLVLAAVCAAAMDSNLHCSATLFCNDLWVRRLRPDAGEREKMRVLRLSVPAFGTLSVGAALAMISVKTALDVWWEWAGILSGGMLGLFLLGRLVPRAGRREALPATVAGVLATLWTTFSVRDTWPWPALRSPLHPLLTLVVATVVIVGVGALLSPRRPTTR